MNKGVPSKNVVTDETKFSKSTFTLTFAIEILNMDVWHDCNEGWVDLGPYHQAMKFQYQLYPGKTFDIDILIWPHVVKIWCGNQYSYVRTWQFLERRWFTFSIRHAFVVRVINLKNYIATVTYAMGGGCLSNNAKNDKNIEAYLPPLKFGERRYFGQVLEKEESFELFISKLLWNLVETYIPASCLDGTFDTPTNVTDKRHQDAILFNVQEVILKIEESTPEYSLPNSEELIKLKKTKKDSKPKEKEKKKPIQIQKEKFAITLSGDAILAGTGRISVFNLSGDRPPDQGNIVVLISSNNLPASDDLPIIFVNIEKINNLPIEEFKSCRLSQIYTQWSIDDETHDSQRQNLNLMKPINFNDSYTIPLQSSKVAEITAAFLDNPFEIQLRGLVCNNLTIMNKEKNLYSSTTARELVSNDCEDILIAVTRIDLSSLSKMNNKLIKGDFPLFPPKSSVVYNRQSYCTNDVNAIKLKPKPTIVIKTSTILQAQTSLEVSIGLVGCKPKTLDNGYARLYCQTFDSQVSNAILAEINKQHISTENKKDILTGFLLDMKDIFFFFVEGPKGGSISEIFDTTAIFHSQILVYFPCTEQFLDRIYPNMPFTKMMVNVFKSRASLNHLLKCSQVYVHPALPLPARVALLKIGRLIATKFKVAPCKSEMPTNEELESFKLELCVPFRFDVT